MEEKILQFLQLLEYHMCSLIIKLPHIFHSALEPEAKQTAFMYKDCAWVANI